MSFTCPIHGYYTPMAGVTVALCPRCSSGATVTTHAPIPSPQIVPVVVATGGYTPADAPMHACVSWTYVPPERAEEALLRIRRLLKEHTGEWTDDDQRLEREAFERLGIS